MTLSSFWYAFLITVFSLLVAYPTAYLLTKTKHKQLWLIADYCSIMDQFAVESIRISWDFGTYGLANSFLRSYRHRRQSKFCLLILALYLFLFIFLFHL